MRKILIAIAAVAALVIMVPLDASARHSGGGGGRGGGGWHGGGGGIRGLSVGAGYSGVRSFSGVRGLRTAGIGRAWRGGRFAHRFGRHGRFFVTASPLLLTAPYWYDDYFYGYYDDACYQLQPVPTRWGLSWQPVWVCY